MLSCLADSESKKKHGNDKKKPRRIHVHPLAMPMDERKEFSPQLLPSLKNSKRPAHKFMNAAIAPLAQEEYLTEVQPASIGMMEHEKIHAYVDDMGNKGNDWAEFRLNTIKLNKEGSVTMEVILIAIIYNSNSQRNSIASNYNFNIKSHRIHEPYS